MTVPDAPLADVVDPSRLAALTAYGILDTEPEKGFDDLALLARTLCGTPIALVSLVAGDRQWFKARVGFPAAGTDLGSSICAHALSEPDLLVIPDLSGDPRTAANPLVTGAPRLRFYAGAPLRTPDGKALGTLCVIDVAPRPAGLSLDQAESLRALAGQVMGQMEQRAARRALAESERCKTVLLELGDRLRDLAGVAEMTRLAAEVAGTALGATRAGFGRLDAAGEHLSVEPDWSAPGQASLAGRHRFADYGDFHEGLRRGEPLVVNDARTDPRTASFSVGLQAIDVAAFVDTPLRERGSTVALFFVHDRVPRTWTGQELAFLRAVADRVEVGVARLRAEERQRLLNRELSHRMKNLIALVQAVVAQSMRGATDVEAVREVLSRRLVALGNAHDILLGGAVGRASLAAIARSGVGVLEDASGRVEVAGPDVEVGAKAALQVALMLHELTTNAVKYGALSVPDGRVAVSWSVREGNGEPVLRLAWREHGGPAVEPPARKGFGTRLIERGLTGQVGGTLTLDYPPEGATCVVEAPVRNFQDED
jgi:two-component sensor histidine kinase